MSIKITMKSTMSLRIRIGYFHTNFVQWDVDMLFLRSFLISLLYDFGIFRQFHTLCCMLTIHSILIQHNRNCRDLQVSMGFSLCFWKVFSSYKDFVYIKLCEYLRYFWWIRLTDESFTPMYSLILWIRNEAIGGRCVTFW